MSCSLFKHDISIIKGKKHYFKFERKITFCKYFFKVIGIFLSLSLSFVPIIILSSLHYDEGNFVLGTAIALSALFCSAIVTIAVEIASSNSLVWSVCTSLLSSGIHGIVGLILFCFAIFLVFYEYTVYAKNPTELPKLPSFITAFYFIPSILCIVIMVCYTGISIIDWKRYRLKLYIERKKLLTSHLVNEGLSVASLAVQFTGVRDTQQYIDRKMVTRDRDIAVQCQPHLSNISIQCQPEFQNSSVQHEPQLRTKESQTYPKVKSVGTQLGGIIDLDRYERNIKTLQNRLETLEKRYITMKSSYMAKINILENQLASEPKSSRELTDYSNHIEYLEKSHKAEILKTLERVNGLSREKKDLQKRLHTSNSKLKHLEIHGTFRGWINDFIWDAILIAESTDYQRFKFAGEEALEYDDTIDKLKRSMNKYQEGESSTLLPSFTQELEEKEGLEWLEMASSSNGEWLDQPFNIEKIENDISQYNHKKELLEKHTEPKVESKPSFPALSTSNISMDLLSPMGTSPTPYKNINNQLITPKKSKANTMIRDPNLYPPLSEPFYYTQQQINQSTKYCTFFNSFTQATQVHPLNPYDETPQIEHNCDLVDLNEHVRIRAPSQFVQPSLISSLKLKLLKKIKPLNNSITDSKSSQRPMQFYKSNIPKTNKKIEYPLVTREKTYITLLKTNPQENSTNNVTFYSSPVLKRDTSKFDETVSIATSYGIHDLLDKELDSDEYESENEIMLDYSTSARNYLISSDDDDSDMDNYPNPKDLLEFALHGKPTVKPIHVQY
mmetsp:Transcript_9971/g.14689  ORF Transcript_9971/g.14689 Transcript_9971/m.14689 type:complete len:784 (-) Transcript_9971:44-2395(-)